MASRTLTIGRFPLAFFQQQTFWDGLSEQERHGSVDQHHSRPFGTDTAWNANGCVQQYWNNEISPLVEIVRKRDESHIFDGIDWRGKYDLDFWMIGRTWSSSKPTLVIQISDIKVMGRFGSRIRKEPRFRRSGFQIKGRQGSLIFKAGSERDGEWAEEPLPRISISDSSQDSPRILLRQSTIPSGPTEFLPEAKESTIIDRPANLFGERIFIREEIDQDRPEHRQDEGQVQGQVERIATFGATIQVGNDLFGLTAAHNFFRESTQSTSIMEEDGATPSYQADVYDETFFELFDDDDNPDVPAADSNKALENMPPKVGDFLPSSVFLEAFEESLVIAEKSRNKIGRFPGYSSTNEVYMNDKLDWALIKPQDESQFDLINSLTHGGSKIITSRVLAHVPGGEVIVVSRIAGYRRAHCSGTFALITGSGCPDLQRAYSITFTDADRLIDTESGTNRGESGAVVVDASTGDAVGLVVAQSTASGSTYIIPLHDIFDDIAYRWGGTHVAFASGTLRHVGRPAPEGTIRIFLLEPGNKGQPIRGSWKYGHPEHEKYDFVSYAWDSRVRDVPIIIQKDQFFITSTVEHILKRLRHHKDRRALWIDAVCMDMKDAKQVTTTMFSQMETIVSNAQEVHIWLGEKESGTRTAFEQIDEFRKNLQPPSSTDAIESLMRRPWFSRLWVVQEVIYARRATLHCGSRQAQWSDFAGLVSCLWKVTPRRWFRQPYGVRLVSLSSMICRRSDTNREVERLLDLDMLVKMFAGFKVSHPHDTIYALLPLARDYPRHPKHELLTEASPPARPFEVSERAIIVIQKQILKNERVSDETSGKLLSTRTIASLAVSFISILRRVALTRREGRGWLPPGRMTFIALKFVLTLQKLVASKRVENREVGAVPTDASTAKLNPPKSGKGLDGTSESVQVDYGLPFVEVAREFVLATIRKTNSLDIICRPWASALEEDNRPSWLSTLSFQTDGDDELLRMDAEALTTPFGPTLYTAGTRMQPDVSRDGRYLRTAGLQIGNVSKLGLPAVAGSIPSEWFELGHWYDQHEEPPESFWRTLVANRDHDAQLPPPYYPMILKASFAKVRFPHDANVALHIERSSSDLEAEFWDRVLFVIWSRRLLRLDSGELGLAPKATQTGDVVCVLYGCSVPVVLRKIGQHPDYPTGSYQLIGECFVYGMMDGEAFQRPRIEEQFLLV